MCRLYHLGWKCFVRVSCEWFLGVSFVVVKCFGHVGVSGSVSFSSVAGSKLSSKERTF